MKSQAERYNTVVIAAHADGRVLPETFDLAAFALKLNDGCPKNIRILILGEAINGAALEVAEKTGIDVKGIVIAGLRTYSSEAYRQILARELEAKEIAYICAPHNSQGTDYAPALAASLNSACISGITGLMKNGEDLFFQKDVFSGKLKANMAVPAGPAVLIVQPGSFKIDSDRQVAPGRVTWSNARHTSDRLHVSGIQQSEADFADITAAKVVIAAGNGIGEQENMVLINELAALFSKSAVAGTRIVCDRGWLPLNRQVGVTGVSVSPALYIACGVSGASQHVMGMRGAGFVVAINTDTHAAIFNEADICIVEDIRIFIPLLLEVWQQRHNKNAVHQAPGNEEFGG